MPPKVKITKESIVSTAVALVRESGAAALNARALAVALGCSTQPIFSNFSSMEELERETLAAAQGIYFDFIQKEIGSGKYPQYKAMGMAYIRFAKEEKELFKLLFMRDRTGEDHSPTVDFEESVKIIMQVNGVTREAAVLMHLEMWSCVHGIGAMLATSFLALDWELIGEMISDIYQGIRAKHAGGEVKA